MSRRARKGCSWVRMENTKDWTVSSSERKGSSSGWKESTRDSRGCSLERMDCNLEKMDCNSGTMGNS